MSSRSLLISDPALSFFVGAIRNRLGLRLKQFILYGSKARGDDQVGSDFDCLLVVDEVTAAVNDSIDEAAGETLYQFSAVMSAMAISEAKRSLQKFNPFLINVLRDGVVL